MSKRDRKSKDWYKKHINDPYVKEAMKSGLRSRSSLKLRQVNDKKRLFKPGMLIIELGAAPGGWSQILTEIQDGQGRIIALDRLEMAPVKGVEIIKGDFLEDETLHILEESLDGQAADWVLSDMAPNMSGHRAVDQPRMMYLCECVIDFANQHIKPDGGVLMKTFQGEGFEALFKLLKSKFKIVQSCKPDASRVDSRELYLLARERR